MLQNIGVMMTSREKENVYYRQKNSDYPSKILCPSGDSMSAYKAPYRATKLIKYIHWLNKN